MSHDSNRSASRAVWAAAALALLAACVSAPQGRVNRYSGGEGRLGVKEEKTDAFFASALRLPSDAMQQSRVNGMLAVQFDLVNTSGGPIGFQWTVDWFDRQGMLVDNSTQVWTPERLAAGAAKTFKVVAPSAAAESWRIQVGSRDEVQ